MTRKERYEIHSGRNQYGQSFFYVYNNDPLPLDPARHKTNHLTEEAAREEIAGCVRRDMREAIIQKAQRLTNGARKQMEWNDYLAYYRDTESQLLADAGLA